MRGTATITATPTGLAASYVCRPDRDLALNSLHVAAEFSIDALAGGHWNADDRSGTFPADFDSTSLFSGSVRRLQVELADGQRLPWEFAEPTSVLIQDNRQWGPTFVIRILRSSSADRPFRKQEPVRLEFALAAGSPSRTTNR